MDCLRIIQVIDFYIYVVSIQVRVRRGGTKQDQAEVSLKDPSENFAIRMEFAIRVEFTI